ncbi:HET-domain-containing protein [Apiospora saccharicola]|uniref:HET-domain-containing protein n=1 Tax=Apiospora saccharicola TaxID=335842 RepID=A0ABR1VL15_9PEZI
MRLLQCQSDGSFCLTRDFVDAIPPYAILSHTWGDDDQEVTFQDMKEGTGRHKDGYRKLEFCGKQASSDGLQYFWVDTCCIDKSSSAELQEAINSMFRWYQNAVACYVYLRDVSTDDRAQPDEPPRAAWKLAFKKSRWLTRGWTLQELVAPTSVVFFSVEGQRLGDKTSMKTLLHEITGISTDALQGASLSDFTVNERMSWLGSRETKRKEDRAYSMIGIFDVYMPLLYGEGEQNAFIRLRKEITERSRGRQGVLHEGSQGRHFLVPLGRNKAFVGRDSTLQQLLERIPPKSDPDGCQWTAIEGLGGIGKTQIALETAFRVRDLDAECSVFWVPAVTRATFENAYREIGHALDVLGIQEDKADVTALVKSALNHASAGRWLLIVDNADDTELVFGDTDGSPLLHCLPSSYQGSILFTTRNHEVASRLDVQPTNTFPVGQMSMAEAKQMLCNGLKQSQIDDISSTERLLDFLTLLPLAIKQASAYMMRTGVTTTKYLRYCLSSDEAQTKLLSEDFGDRHRYAEIANPVAATWIISFAHVTEKWPLAAEFLKLICYFAEKDIPVSLLPGDDEMGKDEAIGVLKGYAFIIGREGSDSFDIHRLVRLAMRNWIKSQGLQRDRVTTSLKSLALAFPFPKHENRNVWLEYLPHAQAALELQSECADLHAQWGLLFNVAGCHSILGKYGDAERLCRPALELSKKVLGREHPITLDSINALALVLNNQGNHKEAALTQRQALEGYKSVLGEGHPRTLESMNNLANVLDRQGKYEEAEQMHRQTLELRKKVLGQEHPNTLGSMNNLAESLRQQGKYEEAEQMHRQTLALKETVLGREHPDTLASMNNLALVLSNQGNQKDAALKQRQALEGYKRILGEGHPRTL